MAQALSRNEKFSLNFIEMRTCVYSLKKVLEAEFLVFLWDLEKTMISTQNLITQNKNQKSWIFMVIQCLSFFQEIGSIKWTDPKVFDLNKCTINSSKGCVLEVELEYPKELRDYSMIIL